MNKNLFVHNTKFNYFNDNRRTYEYFIYAKVVLFDIIFGKYKTL